MSYNKKRISLEEKMIRPKGSMTALVTPFSGGKVDEKTYADLIERQMRLGTDWVVPVGTTGESATITKEEKQEIIDFIVRVNQKRVPLVLGIGGNNTQSVLEEIKTRDLSQIDGILSVAPYYSKPTQEGFYHHYKAIALATDKPIILYNVPGRTSKNMEPDTTLRLANDFSNIVAVKEAGNNQQQYYRLLRDKPDDFLFVSGFAMDRGTANSRRKDGQSG